MDCNIDSQCILQSSKHKITLTGRIVNKHEHGESHQSFQKSVDLHKNVGIIFDEQRINELDKKFHQMKLWRKSVMTAFCASSNVMYDNSINQFNAKEQGYDALCDITDILYRSRKLNDNFSPKQAYQNVESSGYDWHNLTIKESIIDKKLLLLKNKKIKQRQELAMVQLRTKNSASLLDKKYIDDFLPRYSRVLVKL
jgi:hypothetical protein